MNKVLKFKDENLKRAYEEFESWRSSTRGKRRRIPSHLWSLAIDLCSIHPVGRVHRILKLSYTDLKEKVEIHREKDFSKKSELSPFVELKVPGNVSASNFFNIPPIIELSRVDGSRMKISLGSASSINLSELCQLFLKS